jgi:hypothetical protein
MLTSYSCRCKHEFCYLCASRWKTCSCQNADEENVINNGRRDNNDSDNDDDSDDSDDDSNIGDENVEPPLENAEPPREIVARPHEHNYRQNYHGDTICERCLHELTWIMHCRGCGSRVCRRCQGEMG